MSDDGSPSARDGAGPNDARSSRSQETTSAQVSASESAATDHTEATTDDAAATPQQRTRESDGQSDATDQPDATGQRGSRAAGTNRSDRRGADAHQSTRHDERSDREPAVLVEGLRKEYGDVVAVEDVSFSVAPGEVIGLLGPNGAGKTTCIKSVLGLIEPTAGSVRVAGVDRAERPRAAYDRVGAMLEGARNVYWRLTVRENLEFFAGIAGRAPDAVRDRHDELLDRLALAEKADEPVKDLSRGMKQKVSLATTLARDVDVAFLDEPTLGLDVESSLELRRELAALAREEDTAVVVSSHDMDVIQELCDRVIVLSEGEVIADDAVEELLSVFRTQTYRLVFGEPAGESLREELAAFDVIDWEPGPQHTTATVALSDGNELPAVTDRIVSAGGDLERVDTVEPDLEEVFLELTRGEQDD